jgi:hypothetical protein
MNDYEKDILKEERQKHDRQKDNWTLLKPAFCTWIIPNASESSEQRVEEQHHAKWDKAKEGDDIVELVALLISSHNFYDQVASLKEQKNVRQQHDFFAWTNPEGLQQFKLRWDDVIKEAPESGSKQN